MTPYELAHGQIESALRLGILVEQDDPSMADKVPTDLTDAQLSWIGAWLAGEGFHK